MRPARVSPLQFDVASAARVVEGDPISGAFVTVKKCHRQTIRRFLTGVPSGRNALSYTKRRRVPASEQASAVALTGEVLVPPRAEDRAFTAASVRTARGTWLAPPSNQQIDFGTINGPRH
jgi:hypothetical protein